MAERYARIQLDEREADEVEVESAGFIKDEGRSSPKRAVEVARWYDVDLSDHRSKRVTHDQIQRSDLVFVMDTRNYNLLRAEFDSAIDRTYLLKSFGSDGRRDFEISDPHGNGTEAFATAYGELTAAVDSLLRETIEQRRSTVP